MRKDSRFTRRTFVRGILGGAAAAGIAGRISAAESFAQMLSVSDGMPLRALGTTGHNARIFSLGGQATLEQSGKDDQALEIINRALDLGVNYVDTAAAYGRGVSETYIGKVMKSRRKEVFLASKTHNRSYDGSMQLLEQSLEQLQTDHLDLWQLHNVRTQDDLDSIFADDGAVKALEKAREEKMVRFLGITGHRDPFILKKAIERYPFDTILMALNAADKHEASFIDHLLPSAVKKNMGIIGMKVPARGRIFREGGISTMDDAMGYVLTLPVSTVIVGMSTVEELEENVRIAKEFRPFSDEKMAELEALTQPYYAEATWFKSKW
jgi:aryl-alcohol dehydrogenase-like predicted oxidoreductase